MSLTRRIGRSLGAKLTRVTLDKFIGAHASGGTTLDLGAQTGPYAAHFPRRVALDLKPGPGVQIVGDARWLCFVDNSFDVVLCTEMLEHVPEPQRAIDEMWRVLRGGGLLLLTTRFLFPIHDAPADYFRFTKYGLRHLLRAFEIVDLREETTTVGTLAVLLQRLGMQAETLRWSPLRVSWLIVARITYLFSFLITREYGDNRRLTEETGIMTSGYHVACRKPLNRV